MVSNGVILSKRYLIRDEIGSGGMGAVFEAMDLRTGAQVAVKVLHPLYARNPQYIMRLRREAQIAASIRTPRVVRVVDLDEHEGMPFLVMEYVAGENLSDRLAREGPFQVHEALSVCIEVTRALEGAHAAGAVHRDLKPSNVKITEEGEIKVLDFGIARAQDLPGITGTNAFTGTPEYCAPERIEGEGDIRSDIYSLGVMLYELLTGTLPFTGPNPFAILRKHEVEPPPPLPFPIPQQVQAILDRTLAKDPADRYQTPGELMAALRAARDEVLGIGASTPAAGNSLNRFVPTTVIDPLTQPQGMGAMQPEAGVRTVTRPPGMEGPTVPEAPARGGALRGRGLALIAGGVLAVAAVGGGAWAAFSRDDATPLPTTEPRVVINNFTPTQTATTTATPSPTSTRVPTPTPAPTPATASLLGPGDRLVLVNKESITEVVIPEGSDACRGTGRRVVRDVLKVIEIARNSQEQQVVTVAYTRAVPREPNLQCTLPYEPDRNNTVLDVLTSSGLLRRYESSGGTGIAVSGVTDIYGKEVNGVWVFNGIPIDVVQIDLVQIKTGKALDSNNPDDFQHKIRLLPR